MGSLLDQDFDTQPKIREEQLLNTAEGIRIVGWVFLLFAFMWTIFIWTGLRVGSELWLWLTVGSGLAGILSLGLSHYLKTKVVRTKPEEAEYLRAA